MLRAQPMPLLAAKALTQGSRIGHFGTMSFRKTIRKLISSSPLRAAALVAAPAGLAAKTPRLEENAREPHAAMLTATSPQAKKARTWWEVLKCLTQYISWKDAILLCAAAGMIAAAALAGVSIPVLLGQLQLGVSAGLYSLAQCD